MAVMTVNPDGLVFEHVGHVEAAFLAVGHEGNVKLGRHHIASTAH